MLWKLKSAYCGDLREMMTLQAVSGYSQQTLEASSHISLLGFTFIIRSGRTVWCSNNVLIKPERGNRVCRVFSSQRGDGLFVQPSRRHSERRPRAPAAWAGMRAPLCRRCGSEANNTRPFSSPASSCSLSWEKGWKLKSQHAAGRRKHGVFKYEAIRHRCRIYSLGLNLVYPSWIWFAFETASLFLLSVI